MSTEFDSGLKGDSPVLSFVCGAAGEVQNSVIHPPSRTKSYIFFELPELQAPEPYKTVRVVLNFATKIVMRDDIIRGTVRAI